MPGVIESAVLLGLTSLGVSGAALGLATAALTYGILGSLSVGLSILSQSLFRPQAPKPEDVQASVRQPAQPRARHYGRVKVSGPWSFAESKNGTFYKVLALGQGPIDGIEEYWVDDEAVTLNPISGLVTSGKAANQAILVTRLGNPVEVSYSTLMDAFPEYTSAHRGDGVASVLTVLLPVEAEHFMAAFPNGINTNVRLVIRGARPKNVNGTAPVWDDNAAAVIFDYMQHADGMRLPESIFRTPIASAAWRFGWERCNESIARKSGGAEKRYRLWGSYYLNERPADVLGRMLQSCDSRLYPTPDGGLTIDIGTWSEPSVILDEDAITGFSDLSRGKDILTTANVIRATYLGVDQDYQTADADPWIDAADVSARGEISTDMSFIMSPSHGQTRRLMKLALYRANPRWIGAFNCNLRGLAAVGKRFVRIRYPLFGINEVFEVQDFKFVIGEGGILQGVTLQVPAHWKAAGTLPDGARLEAGRLFLPVVEGALTLTFQEG